MRTTSGLLISIFKVLELLPKRSPFPWEPLLLLEKNENGESEWLVWFEGCSL